MADRQVVEQSMKSQWNQAPETVRAEYGGEDYIDKLLVIQIVDKLSNKLKNVNSKEKISTGPGFELGSPALRAGTTQTNH